MITHYRSSFILEQIPHISTTGKYIKDSMENMHTDVRVNIGKGHGHSNNLRLTYTFPVGFVKYMKC